MYCVMRDYTLPEELKEFGRRKGAKKVLESTFTKASGATNDVLRRNKVMECLKTIFPHKTALFYWIKMHAPLKSPARIVIRV